jgi:hypothetical protein
VDTEEMSECKRPRRDQRFDRTGGHRTQADDAPDLELPPSFGAWS